MKLPEFADCRPCGSPLSLRPIALFLESLFEDLLTHKYIKVSPKIATFVYLFLALLLGLGAVGVFSLAGVDGPLEVGGRMTTGRVSAGARLNLLSRIAPASRRTRIAPETGRPELGSVQMAPSPLVRHVRVPFGVASSSPVKPFFW